MQARSDQRCVAPGRRPRVLFGRRADCREVDNLVGLVRAGSSGSLVVLGDPGIGKTRLLDYVADSAPDLLVMRAAGVESEMRLGFAALHLLLAPLLDRVDVLPEPQRDALCSAFGIRAGPPPNRFLVGLATLTLLAQVAAERPMVCLADDAQWLDPESLGVLGFVGRRLRADGVGLVFGVRGAETSSALDGLPTLRLDGLADADARELLASRVAGRLDRSVADRLVVETGGNPLALIELAEGLSAEQLSGRAPLPVPLPVGPHLEGHFLRRVQVLPADTRLLLLVAAAEPPRESAVLWRAAGALGIPMRSVDAAVAARVLTALPWIDFVHPLIRSAVYSGAAPADRRRVHAALAEAWRTTHDHDRSAWHDAAAAVEPDEGVAAELERGAERARGRGGYSAQAAFLLRAAELSPDSAVRFRRLFTAASAYVVAGDRVVAGRLLEQAVPGVAGPLLQAQAQRLRATIEQAFERMAAVPSILLDAIPAVAPLDRRLAREMLVDALHAGLVAREHTVGTTLLDIARVAQALPRRPDQAATIPDLLLDGFAARIAHGYVAAVPLLQRAVEALRVDDELAQFGIPLALLAILATDDLWDDRGRRRVLEHLDRVERGRGALFPLRITLLGLARSEMFAGRFAAAEVIYAEYAEVTEAIGLPPEKVAHAAELLAWQGREVEARAAARSAIDEVSAQRGIGLVGQAGLVALVVLELSRRRYREALDRALPVYAIDSPGSGSNRILVDLIEAGVRAGDREAASAALARLAERAPVSGTPWALGELARGRALLAGDDQAETAYLESIEYLGSSTVMTELARSHLLYGEWLRRRRRRADARRQLRIAYDAFVDMGAAGFAQRTRAELLVTGERARPRIGPSGPSLTPQEAQIARLVTEGATNAEIATRLFVTASTVEYHLSRIFRKFDLTSRRELTRVLSGRPADGPVPPA